MPFQCRVPGGIVTPRSGVQSLVHVLSSAAIKEGLGVPSSCMTKDNLVHAFHVTNKLAGQAVFYLQNPA